MFTEKAIESIKETAENFQNEKFTLLNESDLESILSNNIRNKFDSNVSVNTQSPWYDEYVTNSKYIVDITAYDKNKLYLAYIPELKKKGYKYDDEALTIELKYFRYKEDIKEISGDFKKMTLLSKAPKNECFIIACARTQEIFEQAEIFMKSQLEIFREEFDGKVKIYLFGPQKLIEIK
ncbi:hypothetical protein ABXT06_14625 [Flavobacterium sp. UW10123]|uniref:hypothetical protein n=1 Tax=Flavobacterium sp. UW10123 TaxID=3230800 RepID=UPI003391D8E0